MIDVADVPKGSSTLVAKFTGTSFAKGEHYAVVIGRLGGGEVFVRVLPEGESCPDGRAFNALKDEAFHRASIHVQGFPFSVFVT